MADFGLWGRVLEAATDPTPGAIMRASSPKVMAWVHRMSDAQGGGSFEPWSALAPTLMPLLKEEVGALFLPWSVANAAAIGAATKDFEMTLGGSSWSQEPQKYHARALPNFAASMRRPRPHRPRGDPRGKRLPSLLVMTAIASCGRAAAASTSHRRRRPRPAASRAADAGGRHRAACCGARTPRCSGSDPYRRRC